MLIEHFGSISHSERTKEDNDINGAINQQLDSRMVCVCVNKETHISCESFVALNVPEVRSKHQMIVDKEKSYLKTCLQIKIFIGNVLFKCMQLA